MIYWLERHYLAFTRIVWIATYFVMLYLLNFSKVYRATDILTFLLFVFGVYFASKMMTLIWVIGVAVVFRINVNIELKQSFTINDKYVF